MGRGSRTAAALAAALVGVGALAAAPAGADRASLHLGPASAPGPTCCTRRPRSRRSSRTGAPGGPRRSWSPARPPTAAASSSTRTSSTTTAGPRDARPRRPARRPRLLAGRRHLHLPDRSGVCEQRRRPRRAARQATARGDRLPPDPEHAARSGARGCHDRAGQRGHAEGPPAPTRRPAERFLTWHGTTADLRAAGGRALTPAPTVRVDRRRRQVELIVPTRRGTPAVRRCAWLRASGSGTRPRGGYRLPQAAADATPRAARAAWRRRPRSSTSPSAAPSRCRSSPTPARWAPRPGGASACRPGRSPAAT